MADERAPVAVVTGASRGAGRGIAIALGLHGCTVYVTGRTADPGDSALSGTVGDTAEQVTAAGGKGIAVRVDHSSDAQVQEFFARVEQESGGADILVNNAALIHDDLMRPVPFWEKSLAAGTDLLDVGLRSSYVATYYAAPAMITRPGGLVAFTSASGAVHYVYGAAYGGHKAGMDRFAADFAVDFEPFGVSAVSIWMGGLWTERMQQILDSDPERFSGLAETLETPELTGHVIWALYQDPELMRLSGQTLIGAELAVRYGITDAGGRQPPSYRDLLGVQPAVHHGRLAHGI